MVFNQVWQTSIASACFSSFVHAPHYFHALIGTTLPVAAAGGLSQYVDQSAIGRRRFSRMSPRRARRCAAVDHTGNVAANDCAGTANACVNNSCSQPQRCSRLVSARLGKQERAARAMHLIALLAQQRRYAARRETPRKPAYSLQLPLCAGRRTRAFYVSFLLSLWWRLVCATFQS
jgi:hypothetical protein